MRELFRNGPSFYGEWRVYYDEITKEEGRLYLAWWKDYMIKRLECVGIQIISEDWVDREKIWGLGRSTLGLKLGFK